MCLVGFLEKSGQNWKCYRIKSMIFKAIKKSETFWACKNSKNFRKMFTKSVKNHGFLTQQN
jgi:hypothetical protein